MTEQEFGRYRLVRLLGRGGMGEVWRAVDTDKDREVALKVLGSWLAGDPQFAVRFRREAALAARLNAPNIVPIHDYGEIDGRLFIDMPLVPGTDLGKLLEAGPLRPERAVAVVVQVARALAVAHEAGLVHRDVKPSNVLISTTADGDDHAYLIDFGITKALDGTQLSMTHGRFGTPAYMAPECFLGDGDARSDVYALGCVLYETLTGTPPFSAPHPFAYAYLHQNIAAPRPSARQPEMPRALDSVVARALAKSPRARYPRVTELSAAARAALNGVSPSPAEPDTVTRDRTPTHLPPPVTRTTASGEASLPGRSPAPVAVLTGHTRGVLAVAVKQLGGRPIAVSGSRDETVRIWDLTTATPTARQVIRRTGYVYALAITRLDGRPVAVAGADAGRLRIYDLTSRLAPTKRLTGHTANVQDATLARVRGRHSVVTASSDQTLRIWDLTTHQAVGEPLAGHHRSVFAVAVTQLDGRPVAVSGGADETVRMWDLTTRRPIGRPFTGHTGAVLVSTATQVAGRPVAVTGGIDGTVRVWDLARRGQLGPALTGHDGAVRAIAVTQVGGRPVIVTGGEDETVRLWDLIAGTALGRPLVGHTKWVTAVAVTELGGRTVAVTGSEDETLHIWDLTGAVGG